VPRFGSSVRYHREVMISNPSLPRNDTCSPLPRQLRKANIRGSYIPAPHPNNLGKHNPLHFDVATGKRMFFPAHLFTGVKSAIQARGTVDGYAGVDCGFR
jgi:hypothetical protein